MTGLLRGSDRAMTGLLRGSDRAGQPSRRIVARGERLYVVAFSFPCGAAAAPACDLRALFSKGISG